MSTKNAILCKLIGKQRHERGLANFMGEISRTLFETFTESDLNHIDLEFNKL